MSIDAHARGPRWSVVGTIFALAIALLAGAILTWTQLPVGAGAGGAPNPYTRPFPMPHGYWKHADEFYCFASGGQQGGVYVYGIPSMKLLSEIPVFNADPKWGWTPANEDVRKLMTDPATGRVVLQGDTHHPVLSRTDGLYDGRWLFLNDKTRARVARINLETFRTEEILWIPNVPGGLHGFHCDPDTRLLVGNIELEQYPDQKIRDHLKVPIDREKGPYASCVFGVDVDPAGAMSSAWQVWGPWQFDMIRVGWAQSDGWFFNTAYNTERSVNTVGMFQRPEDYLFVWNVESIRNAVREKKYVTTDAAPGTPVVRWRDVEMYALPCPLNPHGLDVDPTGRYAIVGGKATTLVRCFDFAKIREAIAAKRFKGEEFGVKVLSPEGLYVDIDAGLGPTHIEFDNDGYMYVGFFVDSDAKKIAMGEPWTKSHGKQPWTVVDTIPAHYSIGHLMVPGGDTARPYGKYLVVMNKLAKDTFLPHGPLVTESHELFDITGARAQLVDQMPLPPETHYSQACPVDLIAKKIRKTYDLPAQPPSPGVAYDYKKREVRVSMTAVRSFFTPDSFTVPQGWTVRLTLLNVEQSLDMTHGWALTGYDVMESIDPGEMKTISFPADRDGVYWYYCLWFCSELHLEMRGRMIVIPETEWKPELEWKAVR